MSASSHIQAPAVGSLREQLKAAQEEVARLKNIVRCNREPLKGALGGVVQQLREEQGMKLTDLSEKSGVAAGLLSRLECACEANPTWNNLVKIAKALNTPLSAIVLRWEAESGQNNQALPAGGAQHDQHHD